MTTLSAVVQSRFAVPERLWGSWESYSSVFFLLLQEEPCFATSWSFPRMHRQIGTCGEMYLFFLCFP